MQVHDSLIHLAGQDVLVVHGQTEACDSVSRLSPGQFRIFNAVSSRRDSVANVSYRIGTHDPVHRVRDYFRATQQPSLALIRRGGSHDIADAEGVHLRRVSEAVRDSLNALRQAVHDQFNKHIRVSVD